MPDMKGKIAEILAESGFGEKRSAKMEVDDFLQ
jgi:hypothetical protein